MNSHPPGLTIGTLAETVGVSVETIRSHQRRGSLRESVNPLRQHPTRLHGRRESAEAPWSVPTRGLRSVTASPRAVRCEEVPRNC